MEEGLAAKPDAETKGLLLMDKAMALSRQGDRKAAIAVLRNLATDPNTTFANEHLARQVLATIDKSLS